MTEAWENTADVLITARELARRCRELAHEISRDLAGSERPPVLVGVLKGSTLFLADLVRHFEIEVEVDFISISSYSQSGAGSGVVRIVKDLEGDIVGRDVVVVEDIVDTGLTLNYLRRTLGERSPASLRAVTLLDKAARRIVPVELEYAGFEIPDVFVVGYGLDFQGRYRNAPDILSVKDIAKLANDPLLLVDPLFREKSP
ncbi:MAG TPA: hypoxanthine phosphoribosyltransferase [Actinomycetota bacterium]|nr:hypoxanthine phosphoribosyltransferase [Actinomycetota bacterium]